MSDRYAPIDADAILAMTKRRPLSPVDLVWTIEVLCQEIVDLRKELSQGDVCVRCEQKPAYYCDLCAKCKAKELPGVGDAVVVVDARS